MINIETRIESRRGCGFRQVGGIYLVGPPTGHACCRLPHPLTVCPCCGAGIKPTRGWTWVDTYRLFFDETDLGHLACRNFPGVNIERDPCPLSYPGVIGKAGLLWVGGSYYKTPGDFLAEANQMGISKRLSTVPKGFILGETWVLLAHREAIEKRRPLPNALGDDTYMEEVIRAPAIFSIFKPTGLEYVVKGDETEEDLERIVKRGLTPVDVNPRKAYK